MSSSIRAIPSKETFSSVSPIIGDSASLSRLPFSHVPRYYSTILDYLPDQLVDELLQYPGWFASGSVVKRFSLRVPSILPE